ncbi:type I secretion system permease/ATPase [Brevundimonas sp. SL161]|uniref:type I secretion system permease/ATPase n=1 Tax=Brevundimonas sp. SL161 TaxID=2804613 RepID=UPI003CED3588
MQRPKPKPESLLITALREGRTPLLAAAGFSLVTNALFLALPIYTNQVFGRVLGSESLATLLVLTVGTVFVFVISSLVDVYRARVLSGFGVQIDQRVSSHVFSALFEGVVRREPQAGAQALRDLDMFRQTVTGNGINVLFDLPWMPIYLGVLFYIDPLVGVITLLGGLVLLLLAFIQDRTSRPALRAANDAALKSYAFTEAGLRNSEVVRAMGMLNHIGRQWAGFRARSLDQGSVANDQSDFWGNAIKLVRMVIQVVIIAAGAYLIINQEIGAGMLFANMILSSRALAPIERTVGSWPALIAASQAYERLNILLVEYEPTENGMSLPRPKGLLTVEGVNFAAPDGRLILMGASFGIAPGEFLGVIGPSGAGKSTLARLIVGIWKPLNGHVRLDGSDVFSWNRGEFGAHVGYLPQDTELFAGSVRDNIARFLADASDDEVVIAAQAAGAHDLILRLPQGYDTELGPGGVVLSVGQRQRIGLARALFRNPAMIVLDEPNANLDAQGEEALMRALKGMKLRGGTIVVVTHKPSLLADADKLLVLKEGRIDLFGPRQAVLQRLSGAQPNPAVAALAPAPVPAAPKVAEAGR